MKELSIEEKVKAYDEALKYAKIYYTNGNEDMKMMMKTCFPILVEESEDERIRKELIRAFKSLNTIKVWNGIERTDILAWLEKKGKQKSIEITPKFKVGDWIVDNCGNVWKIEGILNQFYILEGIEGDESRPTIEWVDKTFHLWTIQDAKDGDILINKSNNRENPFIFKETKPSNIKTDILNPLTVLGYCGIGGAGFTKGNGWGDTANCTYYPATKEQRAQLEKTMADTEYTFDFEKKELKKINSDLTEFENALADTCRGWIGEELGWEDYIIKNSFPLLELAKKQFDKYEQPHAWSEEDEKNINFLCELLTDLQVKSTENEIKHGINSHSKYYHDIKEWLKSLQKRIIN